MGDINDNDQIQKKKLILHFDIRNTMIVADSVTSITVEQALNAYLTGVLWGKEIKNTEWVWSSDRPHLEQIEEGTITYYKHLEKIIVKTPPDRTKLRLAVGDFVHTDIGKRFADYYDEHLELLEWKHDYIDPSLTLLSGNGKYYHYVLPAIYRLIQHLEKEQRDFSIIIRTYGLDCGNVLNSIGHCLTTKKHPDFPNLFDMELHPHAGRIIRDGTEIKLQVLDEETVARELTDENAIYEFFCQAKGVQGFRDDFLHWQKNDHHHNHSKPLWIDPQDEHHHHILFDDNFRPGELDSIVNLREKQGDNWVSLNSEQTSAYDNVSLVQADLLEAIADGNYYVTKVQNCELNYKKKLNCRNGRL